MGDRNHRGRLGETGKIGRFGVVGLGIGALACHAKPGEIWRFFELDPLLLDIASRREEFTYVPLCQPKPDVFVGDARINLAKGDGESYDLLIVDAFRSDANPAHLLTAEALKVYADRLASDGVLVLHISNYFLDLPAVQCRRWEPSI